MKTISIYNQKGGVGKTTIAVMLAAQLSRDNKKTLLIDCDPQGNASSWIMPHTQMTKTLRDVIASENTDECIYEIGTNFYMIPTSKGDNQLFVDANNALANNPFLIRKAIAPIQEDVDYIIFDCSPGVSFLERGVILASKKIFIPMKPEGFSINGLSSAISFIKNTCKNFNHDCDYKHIIVNDINHSFSVHQKTLKDFNELHDYKSYLLPQSNEIKKAQYNNIILEKNHKFSININELIKQ